MAPSITWGPSTEYDTGSVLGVGIDDEYNVVEVHRGSQDSNIFYYRVGKADTSTEKIEWGSSTQYDTGSDLAVALNTNGICVEVHRGSATSNKLYYRVGKVDYESKTISFGESTEHDTGSNVDVALDHSCNVIEFHRGTAPSNKLYYKVGLVDEENLTIAFGSSVQYDTGSDLSVCMDESGNCVEIHRGSDDSNKHYSRVGKVDFSEKKIDFTERSSEYDTGSNLSVAIDNHLQIAEVHRGSGDSNLFYCRTGVVNTEKKSIEWYAGPQYDTGSDLAIAMSKQGKIVEVHRGSSSSNKHYYHVGKKE